MSTPIINFKMPQPVFMKLGMYIMASKPRLSGLIKAHEHCLHHAITAARTILNNLEEAPHGHKNYKDSYPPKTIAIHMLSHKKHYDTT
jgi:hypothetical protein